MLGLLTDATMSYFEAKPFETKPPTSVNPIR